MYHVATLTMQDSCHAMDLPAYFYRDYLYLLTYQCTLWLTNSLLNKLNKYTQVRIFKLGTIELN